MKSADYSSKIAYRILTHIFYIFGEIIDLTFAEEYSAIHKGLLLYLGLRLKFKSGRNNIGKWEYFITILIHQKSLKGIKNNLAQGKMLKVSQAWVMMATQRYYPVRV